MPKKKTVARPTRKKKKKKKKASPREAITEPLRRASAAQKKEWAKTEKELVRLRSGGAALFDELWETVHEVMSSDPPLYFGGGMRTAKDFIASSVARDRPRAGRYTVGVRGEPSPQP